MIPTETAVDDAMARLGRKRAPSPYSSVTREEYITPRERLVQMEQEYRRLQKPELAARVRDALHRLDEPGPVRFGARHELSEGALR
jgi:hypothetical protein